MSNLLKVADMNSEAAPATTRSQSLQSRCVEALSAYGPEEMTMNAASSCGLLKDRLRSYWLLTSLVLSLSSSAVADDWSTNMKGVTLWYEAFDKHDPSLIDRILDENWVDIPAAPGQPPGSEGAKRILEELTTSFPDLKVTIEEILQDGSKVIVRSEISGTHKADPHVGVELT